MARVEVVHVALPDDFHLYIGRGMPVMEQFGFRFLPVLRILLVTRILFTDYIFDQDFGKGATCAFAPDLRNQRPAPSSVLKKFNNSAVVFLQPAALGCS